MTGVMWMIAGATVLFAAVMSYAMTRRYNWGVAVMLPVLALITMIAMRWQAEGMRLSDGLGQVVPMLVFSSPILIGSLLGIAVARVRRG